MLQACLIMVLLVPLVPIVAVHVHGGEDGIGRLVWHGKGGVGEGPKVVDGQLEDQGVEVRNLGSVEDLGHVSQELEDRRGRGSEELGKC